MRLYRAFFEREPDVPGAVYWIEQINSGATMEDLTWAFSESAEFRARYGEHLSIEEFVTIVYGNVLGRTPDPEGFQYWVRQMRVEFLSWPEMVRWVVENLEFINRYLYLPIRIDDRDEPEPAVPAELDFAPAEHWKVLQTFCDPILTFDFGNGNEWTHARMWVVTVQTNYPVVKPDVPGSARVGLGPLVGDTIVEVRIEIPGDDAWSNPAVTITNTGGRVTARSRRAAVLPLAHPTDHRAPSGAPTARLRPPSRHVTLEVVAVDGAVGA